MLVVSCRLLACRRDDLVLDVDLGVRGDVLQLLDLGFELGDRLFEIEESNGHSDVYREREDAGGRLRARKPAYASAGAVSPNGAALMLTGGCRAIEHLHAIPADQALQLLDAARGVGSHVPVRAERERAARRPTRCIRTVTGHGPPRQRRQDLGQPVELQRRVRSRRPAEHDAARLLSRAALSSSRDLLGRADARRR